MTWDDSHEALDRELGEEWSPGASVATDLYWIMPGPRRFIDSVTSAISVHHLVRVRVPAVPIAGLHTALDSALQRAHFDNEHTRWLKIHEGMDVSTEIGSALGSGVVFPEQLAHVSSPIKTIVLDACSENAVEICEKYLTRAEDVASKDEKGREQISVLALLPVSRRSADNPEVMRPEELVFAGALTVQELMAYVAVRMIDRGGPSDTGLLRMLVTEFAGFDVRLAEVLISLQDDALLALPRSLEPLCARSEPRWQSGRWSAGCYAHINGSRTRHALHELYLSRHEGPDQRDATDWLKRRYWRACVRTLLPWLEERRSRVIDVLRPALVTHLKASGGKAVRTTDSGFRLETSLEDLEYNQIPGLVRHERFDVSGNFLMRRAVDVCFAAKKVRDDIAHMRPPQAGDILALTSKMEDVLSA
jgi:hypothetical protein